MELIKQIVLKKQEQFDNLYEEGYCNAWDLWQAASLAHAFLELNGKPVLTPQEIATINAFHSHYQEEALERAIKRSQIASDKKGRNISHHHTRLINRHSHIERQLLQKARKVISAFLYEVRPDPAAEPEIEEMHLRQRGVWMVDSSYYEG